MVQKEVRSIADKQGNTIRTETVSEGKSGKNFNNRYGIAKSRGEHRKILKQYKGSESMLDRAFVVMMNIINGWEKACRKDGKMEVEDYALGTLTSSYELGSTVKGATVLTGFETNAITHGTHFMMHL